MVHNWDHLVYLLSTNFFHAKAKFTLAKLDGTQQYSMEDLDIYVRRFHEKALECHDLVEE